MNCCVVVVGSTCSSHGKAIYSVINQVYVKDSCLEELLQSLDAKGYRIRLSQTSANSGEAFASSVRLLNCRRAKLWSGLFIINGLLQRALVSPSCVICHLSSGPFM